MVHVWSSLPPPSINKSYNRIDKYHSVMCTTGISNDYNHRTTQKSSKDTGKRASDLDRRSEQSLYVVRNSSCNFWYSLSYPVTHICSGHIIDTIFNPLKIGFLFFIQCFSIYEKTFFIKLPRLQPFVILVWHVDKDKDGALVEWFSRVKWNTKRKCPSATLSTTMFMWTDLDQTRASIMRSMQLTAIAQSLNMSVKVLFSSVLPNFWNSIAFIEGSQIMPT